MSTTKDLKIERFLPARPGKVWMAWTEPDMVAKWWTPYPKGTAEAPEWEVATESRGKVIAKDADGGGPLTFYVTFNKVAPSKEITFFVQGEENGPRGPEMSVQFEPAEDGTETKMIFNSPGIPAEHFEDASSGWHAFFDKLEDALTGDSTDDLMFEGGEGMSVTEGEESE
jgi:uncharacterized protein YndB with AHSA1/START domain